MATVTASLSASDVLTPEELAENLKVSRSWVMDQLRPRNRRENPLPYFRVGRFPRFSWTAVSDWMKTNENSAPVPAKKKTRR